MARKIKRRIKVKGQDETPAERQARTAVRFIADNPHYLKVLEIIRSGTPNSKIAEWGITRGVFHGVNQKTVVSYLQYFRKLQPALCKPQEDVEQIGFDHLFDGAMIVVDEETELLRLIQLQKARVGIAYKSEITIGLLMQSNRREVEELRNLIVDLAKLRGLISTGSTVNVNTYSEGVKDELKTISQDEGQRNVLATLVHELVSVNG